jgi:hypothetical protein
LTFFRILARCLILILRGNPEDIQPDRHSGGFDHPGKLPFATR